MKEIFKDIIGYEWSYQVSNLWRIKSFPKHTSKWGFLKCDIWKFWHWKVALFKQWKRNIVWTHRLVAQAFLWLDLNNKKHWTLHKCEKLDENNALYNWVDNLWIWSAKDNNRDTVKKWRHKWIAPMKWIFWKDNPKSIKINQLDKEWKLIKTWDSSAEVERNLWIQHANISAVLKWRRNYAWWYKWEYLQK